MGSSQGRPAEVQASRYSHTRGTEASWRKGQACDHLDNPWGLVPGRPHSSHLSGFLQELCPLKQEGEKVPGRDRNSLRQRLTCLGEKPCPSVPTVPRGLRPPAWPGMERPEPRRGKTGLLGEGGRRDSRTSLPNPNGGRAHEEQACTAGQPRAGKAKRTSGVAHVPTSLAPSRAAHTLGPGKHGLIGAAGGGYSRLSAGSR